MNRTNSVLDREGKGQLHLFSEVICCFEAR